MKIFTTQSEDTYNGYKKVNFVDENNIVLGYSMDSQCYDDFGWFISDKCLTGEFQQLYSARQNTKTEDILKEVSTINSDAITTTHDMPGWSFDRIFYIKHDGHTPLCDECNLFVCRIINGDQEKFIHLFNCHNGYYGHGFSFEVDGRKLNEGIL